MAASKRTRATITTGAKARPDLAAEAEGWKDGRFAKDRWVDAPEAVPAKADSVAVSIRFPARMLEVLRAFAAREGLGYQVLLKRWLDERLLLERDKLVKAERARGAPLPELMVDSAAIEGPHYRIAS